MTELTPRSRARRRLSALVVTTAIVSLLPSSAGTPAAADPPPPSRDLPADLTTPPRGQGSVSRLDVSLLDDAASGRFAPGEMSAAARAADPTEVTVIVEAADGPTAAAAAEASGGQVTALLPTAVKAQLPASRLRALAATPGVEWVREPEPVQMQAVSEGVADTIAEAWHTGGNSGAGTKVAILDGGFAGYASRLGTELPASVEIDLTRCGGTGSSPHGTAVAEIVHDMAPGASLRLVCIQDDADFVSALAQMQAHGVDVVNGSIGFNLTGRGDGADGIGTIADAVRKLRDQDILYVASAGNAEGTHSSFRATGDPVGGNDLGVNVAPPGQPVDQAMEFWVPGNGSVRVDVKWDAWPTTRQDFDLFILNGTCGDENGVMNARSGGQYIEGVNDQAGSSYVPPIESVDFTNCSNEDELYWVVIDRYSGNATPRVDVYFQGDVYTPTEYPTSSSVVEPATSPAVMTVGAYCESNGVIEPFSSRGPTIDGRVKPDIAGPDGTSGSVYGPQDGCNDGFRGTSASAPHVAGAAALLLEANPGLDVAELQRLLEDRAQDVAPAGRDNTFGAGRLRLGSPGDAALAAPQAFSGMTPTRLFDSRPGVQYPAESPNRTTPLGTNGKVQVQVRGIAGVPADATAVVLNVTAVSPTSAGYLVVHPGGTVPNASNLNFAAGQNVAVHVTATVGSDGRVELVNAVGFTHVIVDVAGWYGPTGSSGPSTDRLTPLTAPARALDSRPGSPQGYAEGDFGVGGRTTPVPEDGSLSIRVAGLGGVPADATAVVMNVAAVAPTKSTFVTAHPTGLPRPVASNLNAKGGQTIANLVVMPVGTNGQVTFYNQRGETHLVVDVVGWFQPNVGAGYLALDPPTRNLDSRTGTGFRRTILGAGATHPLKVGRYNGVPADAAAVMLGVVAVSGSTVSDSWLTVYPGTSALPGTSSVNFAAGATVANAAISRVGSDGSVGFNNARGNAHVISDLAGYFIDPANIPVPPP